jgi:type I restriction enzyme S subunit
MSQHIRLGEIADIASGGTPSRTKPEYWGGNIPWVKTGLIQNCIIHESDIDEWITERGLKKSSAKLVPRGTILMAMIGQGKTRGQVAILDLEATTNQNAASIRPNENYDRDYVYQQLLFRYDKIRNISNSSGQQNLNLDIIKSIRFPMVSLSEQTATASLLSTWDFAIEKTELLIAAKEKWYLSLLSSLITNGKYPHGHIREFAIEVSKRNSGATIAQVLSVTNRNGFVLPEDQFERQVASSDLSNYKVVTSGQYAYNPSRINVGSIARLDNWDVGVLSPMYVVFKLDETKVNSDFFLHWLESHEAKQRIVRSAQGSVRETVSFTDLAAIPFPLPLIDQQKQISAILTTARQEINLLKKQADAYRRQKRGLMQKLLTGEWRVRMG